MAAKKRTGLGRGIGALIPQSSGDGERPVDVFFPSSKSREESADGAQNSAGADHQASPSATRSRVTSAAAGPAGGVSEADEQATGLREVPGATLTTLLLADIVPNRAQPRREFEEEALEELTHSVREFGVFQPIVVRAIEPAPTEGPQYELIMGERRLRAAGRAGLTEIPAIVRSTADEHMLRDALLENLHRAELNPLEEASAYQQLMQDFDFTQEQLAEQIGRSRPQISNMIRLLRLPEAVQARVAAGVLSAGHARAILSLDGDVDAMQRLADKVVNEGLSVRATEAAAASSPTRRLNKPRAGGVQAQLDEIAERLGDRFDTRVSLKLGSRRGQLVIDFATISDLKRILDELDDPGFA